MPRNNRIPTNMGGMGLLKTNYGPNDTSVDDQLNALQKRGNDLAAKVKASQPNASVSGLQAQVPQVANAIPAAPLGVKRR